MATHRVTNKVCSYFQFLESRTKNVVLFVVVVYSMMFENSKNFIGDNTIEGLDELARETVSNDNESQDDVR